MTFPGSSRSPTSDPPRQDIDRLLTAFRLKRVEMDFVGGNDTSVALDLSATCPIAIRRSPSLQQRAPDLHSDSDDCVRQPLHVGGAVSLAPDYFDLPAMADACFQRLFEHFPDLIVANHRIRTTSDRLAHVQDGLPTGRQGGLVALALKLDSAEELREGASGDDVEARRPGWMLCSDYYRCW